MSFVEEKPRSFGSAFIAAAAGVAFLVNAELSHCDSACNSNMADVKKVVDDVVRMRRRRDEENVAPHDNEEYYM